MLMTIVLAAAAAAQVFVVKAELTVDQEGAVSHCAVIETNFSVETEAARKFADEVCHGLVLHGRFAPQRDASGHPVEFKTTTTVRFQVADEPSTGGNG